MKRIAYLIVLASLVFATSACQKREEDTPAYKAACEGPPLRNVQNRSKAQEDGYTINHRYDCIDKASFAAVAQSKAAWDAAHTPEALAKQAEEAERRKAYYEKAAREADAAQKAQRDLDPIVVHTVDVNTASEYEIAQVIGIGPDVAAQIVMERNQHLFESWADVAHRVVALSAAQSAIYASICGLTVDGKSMEGFPPDGTQAALIKKHVDRMKNR